MIRRHSHLWFLSISASVAVGIGFATPANAFCNSNNQLALAGILPFNSGDGISCDAGSINQTFDLSSPRKVTLTLKEGAALTGLQSTSDVKVVLGNGNTLTVEPRAKIIEPNNPTNTPAAVSVGSESTINNKGTIGGLEASQSVGFGIIVNGNLNTINSTGDIGGAGGVIVNGNKNTITLGNVALEGLRNGVVATPNGLNVSGNANKITLTGRLSGNPSAIVDGARNTVMVEPGFNFGTIGKSLVINGSDSVLFNRKPGLGGLALSGGKAPTLVLDGANVSSAKASGDGILRLHKSGTQNLDAATGFAQLVGAKNSIWTVSGTGSYQSVDIQGAGSLTLDGANITATSSFVARPGTMIGGTGVITGDLTASGVDITPGASIGTLRVVGNADLSGSTLNAEIDGDSGASDLVDITGTATAPKIVNVTATGSFSGPAKSFVVLSAAGGLTAAAAPEFTDNLPFVDFMRTDGANDVTISSVPLQLTAPTTTNTKNHQALGTALQIANVGGPAVVAATPVPNAVTPGVSTPQVTPSVTNGGATSGNPDFDKVIAAFNSLSNAEIDAAFNAIIAEPYAAYLTVELEQANRLREEVLDQARTGCDLSDGGFCGWVSIDAAGASIDDDADLSGFDYTVLSTLIGVETELSPGTRIGGAFGYGRLEMDGYNLADAEIDGDAFLAALYGVHRSGPWRLSGMAGLAYSMNEAERNIAFGAINRTAESDFDTLTFTLGGEAAYRFDMEGGFFVEPEAGVAFAFADRESTTETGAGSLNLATESANGEELVTSVGVRVGTVMSLADGGWFAPELRARYERDWLAGNNDEHDVAASFANVAAAGRIDTVGLNPGQDRGVVGAGFTYAFGNGATMTAGVDYRFSAEGDEISGGLRFGVTF